MARIVNLRKADIGPELVRLTSFKLRKLTNMYTKASASVYEREFDLTLNEWRIIALLYSGEAMSMLRLSEQAQFDRGLTSRTVSALIESGLVGREIDGRDARAALLSLTDRGLETVRKISPVAQERNEQLLSCLTNKEREVVEVALDKLTHQARVMLDIEREKAKNDSRAKRGGPL